MIRWLYSLTYERVTLDKVNKKLIRPVPGLVVMGEQYYEFENIADIPETRRMEYNSLREEAVMGITREMLIEIFEGIIESNDKGKVSNVGSLAFMAKDMVANITSKEILYKMASLMYFTEDEDLSMYDLDYNNRKIELFKQIKDQSFFFARLLDNGLKINGDPLRSDIQKYLRESEIKEKAYLRLLFEMLGKSGTKDIATPSTPIAKASRATSRK